MLKLRILRTFKWIAVFPNPPIYGPGGAAHDVLQHSDRLQYSLDGDTWHDVPIVEEPKPDSPATIRARKESEELREAIEKMDIPRILADGK